MVGSRIKEYLVSNGIKQTYLSEQTGIPKTTMNSILNGNRKIEAVEYWKICKLLNVDYGFFLEESED